MTALRSQFQDNAARPEEKLNRQLVAAVWKNRFGKIRELVVLGADPDTRRGPQSRTLLMRACEQGDVATVRVLISSGAKAAGVTDKDMDTCLHIAAGSDKPELISIMLAKGANTEARNRAHYTPLMVAASLGKAQNIRLLIARGADPKAATKSGLSALHVATLAGEAETVALLLRNGADPETKADKGLTPLGIARRINDPEVMKAYLTHFSMQHSRKVYNLHRNRAKVLSPA